MSDRWCGFVAVLAWFFAVQPVAGSTALCGKIHVALRSDGATGSGTVADPFDGSVPQRLQEILESAPEGACLSFGPGTFSVGAGLTVADGKSLSLVGSGRTVTTLKLRKDLPSGESRERPAVSMVVNIWGSGNGYTDRSALYVSDLTLDANVDESPRAENFSADALHTNYPLVVVERVRIVNCGGSENYPTESFHALAWYPNPDQPSARSWPWYQRFSDVHVIVRAGQTRTATVLSVGSSNGLPPIVPASGYAIIEDSVFEASATQDNTYVATIGTSNGSVFRNNVMILRGKATAMNIDTWDHRGMTVEGNRFFLHDEASGVRLGSGPNRGIFRNDVIRNNQFFSSSARIPFAIQLNGVSGVTIERNEFQSMDGVTGALLPIDVCNQYVPHKNGSVVVRDNLLDTRLFQFPILRMTGEPRSGVVTILEGNRSIDGMQGDGSDNGLIAEHADGADLNLAGAAPSTQVVVSVRPDQRVRLPRIAPYPNGEDCVPPGTRFRIVNAGSYPVFLSAPGRASPIPVGATRWLLATSRGWVAISESVPHAIR